ERALRVRAVDEQRARDAERHLRRADRALDIAAHLVGRDRAPADERQLDAELLLEPLAPLPDRLGVVALLLEARHEIEVAVDDERRGRSFHMEIISAQQLPSIAIAVTSPRDAASGREVGATFTSASGSRVPRPATPGSVPRRSDCSSAIVCSAPEAPSVSPSTDLVAVTRTSPTPA